MNSVNVLVVGAGPTGLTLAYDLARRGVSVRIIDRDAKFTTASRGKAGIQPRTQEVFDDFGIVDEVLKLGTTRLPFRRFHRDRIVSEAIPYEANDPRPDAPYRRLLFVRQSLVEGVLRDRLAETGNSVERGVKLLRFEQHAGGVVATLESEGGAEEVTADYLVGCDGGASTVRKALGLEFRGFTEEDRKLLVGDVEVDGLDPDAWYQWYDMERGILLLCPLADTNTWQIQASPPADADGAPMGPSLAAMQTAVDRITGMPIRLSNPTWLSTMKRNVRMVDTMRVDRVLLAGDAAHVHPVTAALGANTGVQDAYNLGWKLARVITRGAGDGLLDTYERERVPIAEWTLKTACDAGDLIFAAMLDGKGGAEKGLTEESLQLGLHYREGPLSRDLVDAGAVRAGDRAPDSPCPGSVDGATTLFDAFRGPHLTLIGVGPTTAAALETVSDQHGDVHTVLLTEHPEAYAGPDDRLVLVRPDGYIGLVAPADDARAVLDYLAALDTFAPVED
ncbi:FAD-dependent oxidoreductase [Saccharopolyspora indica]|uniref:FAD-dependent oxidoreductase n=3 Tax=Saccharopolyspora indica TaxID=1229659 RepID=UPI0022EAB6EF|nr:FAD-dependent oxidoreductase [Saccharopolyspora indica]MDA3649406.1 FAD-dependent oxidoreductase [Saccharopolyspora indica]